MQAIETNWEQLEKLRNRAVWYDFKYKRCGFIKGRFEDPSIERRIAVITYIKRLFPQKGIYWDDCTLVSFCGYFALENLERRIQLMKIVHSIFKNIENYEYKFQCYDLNFRLDDGSVDCPYIITWEDDL